MENIQNAIDVKGEGIFKQAELFFDDLFLKKLPPLPDNIRDLLVKLAPFWAILLIVLAAFSILLSSLSALFTAFGAVLSIATLSGSGLISSVLSLVNTIIGLGLGAIILLYLAKSLKGLFNPAYVGWQSLFRAEVVWVAYSVIAWLFGLLILVTLSGFSAILGVFVTIISLAIQLIIFGAAFYLLFQIKGRYARLNA
ncbi:MAG TPA: hypothetical protein VFS27_06305 [Blastocatellia bacterium]|jgi:hypothetical protein|nr:hypothetical protein [Blastocatellia bacterium]